MLCFSFWNYYIEKTDENGSSRFFESSVYEKVRDAYKKCIYLKNLNNEMAHFEIKQEPIQRSYDFDVIEVLKTE